MTIHNEPHPKSNVDHLYIPRRKGGRELQGVEETVNLTNLGLEYYLKDSRERLLNVARSVDIGLIEPIRQTTIEAKKQKKDERKISWEENKSCIASLYNKLRKWGIRIGDNG